jgi:hypothetical protein
VASRTLPEPLAWENPKMLTDDVDQAVFALEQEEGRDL